MEDPVMTHEGLFLERKAPVEVSSKGDTAHKKYCVHPFVANRKLQWETAGDRQLLNLRCPEEMTSTRVGQCHQAEMVSSDFQLSDILRAP
jgi:hypothetical protein